MCAAEDIWGKEIIVLNVTHTAPFQLINNDQFRISSNRFEFFPDKLISEIVGWPLLLWKVKKRGRRWPGKGCPSEHDIIGWPPRLTCSFYHYIDLKGMVIDLEYKLHLWFLKQTLLKLHFITERLISSFGLIISYNTFIITPCMYEISIQ